MSVDSILHLPCETRPNDIARAITMLCGLNHEKVHPWDKHPDEYSIRPTEVRFTTYVDSTLGASAKVQSWCVGLYNIEFVSMVIPSGRHSSLSYYPATMNYNNPEWGPHSYLRGASCAFNIALFTRLAAVFGGWVDYNDCDDVDANLFVPRPRPHNHPEDGDAYFALNHDIQALTPITKEEILLADLVASYRLDDDDLLSLCIPTM